MSEEDEYEIESLLEARVEKEKGRREKLAWKFRVRWKGYTPEDDTWEPIENMEGSEETVTRFWERINTNGRDHHDLRQFKAGEVFLPIGPPKKRKVKVKEPPSAQDTELKGDSIETTFGIEPAPPSSTLRKRGYGLDTDLDDGHSPKRLRPAFQTFGSKPNTLLSAPNTPAKTGPTETLNPAYERTKDSAPPENLPSNLGSEVGVGVSVSLNPGNIGAQTPARATISDDFITLPSTRDPKSSMPLHRARTANPLVKLLNDHHTASLKGSRELGGEVHSKRTAASGRKPGPGRSSDGLLFRPATLLTADKGQLKSIKGKDRGGSRVGRPKGMDTDDEVFPKTAEVVDHDIPVQPPEPSDILELAGLDPNSGNLPDYEDEANSTSVGIVESGENNLLPHSVTNNLFLSTIPDTGNNSMWKHSTIFGPLGLGTDTLNSDDNMETNHSVTPFQITLDSSTSISVVFVNAIPPTAFTNTALSQRGPPGKFYHGTYASDLLGTLRTKGSFAHVHLPTETSGDQDINFKHFVKRLVSDELFVAMVDRDLLAFCSSDNALFVQRLNIPSNLVTMESILVAHVSIEDYSAFADATANADDTIWSQYILSAGDV